ncbi:hypothetical protein SDC9_153438 [bioreactor metagenome]|uniref:Homoserine dehydrogenase catalytic domain-containing protein n=1 Tax=bioreactor metagenome TaxID=1076179 RepID=A0A645EY57_9ZZZZ
MSSLAFGKHIDPNKIHTEGITNISLSDVEYAKADNRAIKLLGRSEIFEDGRVFAMVSPCMIQNTNQLANVEDVYNGILVAGDSLGEVMFYGRGAGKLPTASAVVADVIDAVKHLQRRLWFYWGPEQENCMMDYRDVETRFYLRFSCTDKAMAMELTSGYFGYCHDIRLNVPNEVAFITPLKEEGQLLLQLEEYQKKECITSLSSKIRVIE